MNTAFNAVLQEDTVYKPSDLQKIIANLAKRKLLDMVDNGRGVYYYNTPCSFDIETTSMLYNGEKVGFMYVWQLGLGGYVIIGRTWEEFKDTMDRLVDMLCLEEDVRLVIYVQNLSYEFQFIRKLFNFIKVFSMDKRKPIQSTTSIGIEFKCSYFLTGKSLESIGEDLVNYKVKKQVGNLDYDKIRHSTTPLTKAELLYCVDDVKVVMACIQEKIDIDGDITKIPLTNTGYVRRKCREACIRKDGKFNRSYREIMRGLTLDPDEYLQLKQAFQGGFTHANPHIVGETLENVRSFDFTSSYPAVMVCEKFPMSKGEKVVPKSKKELEYYLNHYCCLFDVSIDGLEPKVTFENYLSLHKCRGLNVKKDKKNYTVNNGRIVRAKHLETTITEVDYSIMTKFYKWEKCKIGNFRIYAKAYLPQEFIEVVLEMYQKKTELKGIEGMEIEYLLIKGMLNACYGMTVTDIVRPEIIYEKGDWQDDEVPDLTEAIKKYNRDSKRFLFYPWGVWITAYARRNLFTGILECQYDYVYSDTDSLKILNWEKHKDYIESYNRKIEAKMNNAMKHFGFDKNAWKPKNKKGEEKPLGFWDDEGMYSRFKTLGAKRYMTEKDGKLDITVSGLKKKDTVAFLKSKGIDPFLLFDDDLSVPPENTGKMTHTYIDVPRSGDVVDYLGNEGHFSEKSCIHLENAGYVFSRSEEFIDYLGSLIQSRVDDRYS